MVFSHDAVRLTHFKYAHCPRWCLRPISVTTLFFTSLIGCDYCPEPGPHNTSPPSKDIGINSKSKIPEDRIEASRIVLTHHLGIIRPQSSAKHRFSINNDSKQTWTVKKMHVSCSCTVPAASFTRINPGCSENVEILYKSGRTNLDDKRSVLIEFVESDAPTIQLFVEAQVRSAATIVPPTLLIPEVGAGIDAETHFEVHNYDSVKWDSLRLKANVPWLSSSETLVSEREGDEVPRQIWRVNVRTIAKEMGLGRHRANLVVSVADNLTTVPFQTTVVPATVAIPGQFFFGAVPVGETVTRKLLVRFPKGEVPIDLPNLSSNFEDCLDLKWGVASANYLELIGTLKAKDSATDASLTGSVTVGFKGNELPALSIPVRARIISSTKQP